MGKLEENPGGNMMLWEEYDLEYVNYETILKSILEEYEYG